MRYGGVSFRWPAVGEVAGGMMQGASYSVFQIALGSTLLLDLSDTKKRTEAAHVYYWFTRLALVFGPLSGIVVPMHYGVRLFAGVSVLFCFAPACWF